eukprot:TRINITY_DN41308_c0_g1_i1.p1 TRINITY_DN41308_c0_g1~~TRINITY_DN41308_c0_g1_i1.p1  ORF type:complete len:404 (-),score=62.13 TRINITY_DN41308_c0_g1_i1:306-1517(-)
MTCMDDRGSPVVAVAACPIGHGSKVKLKMRPPSHKDNHTNGSILELHEHRPSRREGRCEGRVPGDGVGLRPPPDDQDVIYLGFDMSSTMAVIASLGLGPALDQAAMNKSSEGCKETIPEDELPASIRKDSKCGSTSDERSRSQSASFSSSSSGTAEKRQANNFAALNLEANPVTVARMSGGAAPQRGGRLPVQEEAAVPAKQSGQQPRGAGESAAAAEACLRDPSRSGADLLGQEVVQEGRMSGCEKSSLDVVDFVSETRTKCRPAASRSKEALPREPDDERQYSMKAAAAPAPMPMAQSPPLAPAEPDSRHLKIIMPAPLPEPPAATAAAVAALRERQRPLRKTRSPPPSGHVPDNAPALPIMRLLEPLSALRVRMTVQVGMLLAALGVVGWRLRRSRTLMG